MGGEDTIKLHACGLNSANERDEACNMSHEFDEAGVPGFIPNGEGLGRNVGGAASEEGQLSSESEHAGDVTDDPSSLHEMLVCVKKSSESVALQDNVSSVNDAEVEEGQLVLEMSTCENTRLEIADCTGTVMENQRESVIKIDEKCVDVPFENCCVTENATSDSYPEIGSGSTSCAKTMRSTFSEQPPSVLVKYHGLSRQGKRKLEELLKEWSIWTAKNSSCSEGENQEAESGEGIYFPALDTGTGRNSAVSYWVENDVRKQQNKNFTPAEDDSVPLYDRGFALGLLSADGSSNLEGGLELLEAPRCFNCGSYSHSLKECPKPRDNNVVNNSRKQLKTRRNQIAGARNVVRYYQDSPGGKYEGLKPGFLDAETRRVLGLGELDPPPWLNRMREIGYPPGYLEEADEDLPSGITIFAEEESKEEKEDGEILEAEVTEPQKKMTVEFPGINAPIPQDTDERLWTARPLNPDRHPTGDAVSSEFIGRARYREHSSRGFRGENLRDFEQASGHPSRYADYDFGNTGLSFRDNASMSRSPSSGRSLGDRARYDPSESEDSLAYRLYSSYSYTSARRFSEHANGLDTSREDHPDYSSSRERDRYRHRSGR